MHLLYRSAYFDEIAIQVIESDDTLSPTVRHKVIDIFRVRIESFKLFYEAFNLRLFEIQLSSSQEYFAFICSPCSCDQLSAAPALCSIR